MLECRLLSWCINMTTILRNNYWIFFFQFSCIKKYTHFSAQSTFPFCIMSCVNKDLNRKARNYVIKNPIPYLSSLTLWAVLPSYIIPVRGTKQQKKKTNNKLNWPMMFRSSWNLHRKALNYRYVIKSHERIHGGLIPYISSVTLRAVLPSNVIPVRWTTQQNTETISTF